MYFEGEWWTFCTLSENGRQSALLWKMVEHTVLWHLGPLLCALTEMAAILHFGGDWHKRWTSKEYGRHSML
jgi:hypothetical protein